jgi:AraC family transcriptional regulator, chitin signaling transcriptional activator
MKEIKMNYINSQRGALEIANGALGDTGSELERRVDLIHPGFLRKVQFRAPDLTPMELQICMLTRLQMRTKEAAAALNVAKSSVERHRWHVRTKLGYDRSENLLSALLRI